MFVQKMEQYHLGLIQEITNNNYHDGVTYIYRHIVGSVVVMGNFYQEFIILGYYKLMDKRKYKVLWLHISYM